MMEGGLGEHEGIRGQRRGGGWCTGPDIRAAFNRIAGKSAEGDTNSLLPIIAACFLTIFTLIKCKSGGLCASVEIRRENS